jgi:hypothetical protein
MVPPWSRPASIRRPVCVTASEIPAGSGSASKDQTCNHLIFRGKLQP